MTVSFKTDQQSQRARGIVAFVGILIILIGQNLLYALPVPDNGLPPRSIFLSVAGVLLFMASFFIRLPPAWSTRFERIKIPEKALWITASIGLSCLTVFSMLLFMKYEKLIYTSVLISWFAAGVLYIYAFREQLPSRLRIKEWFRDHRMELIILGVITLLAAAVRLYMLGIFPRVVDGDEGLLGEFAKSVTTGGLANPFALWENYGGLYMQALYICIQIFGPTGLALRLLPAISGILAIPALYLFTRQLTGKRLGMLAAAFLAFSNAHINFSRIGAVGYIHDTWLVPLEFFLLLAGMEKRKTWMAAAAGVLLAIHYSVYLTAQLITGLIFVFMLITLIFMRSWFLPKIRQAAAFWGALAIMILPEVFFGFRNPNDFFDRLIQNGSFQTGWAAQTAASTGQSIVQVLAGRILHVFLSLIYYPANAYYGSPLPLLTMFVAVFLLAGLGIALLRLREPGMLLLNGYFWAPIVALGIMAIPPSADSYRILIVIPAVFILVAIAIDKFLGATGVTWAGSRKSYSLLSGGLLLSSAIFGLWVYFGDVVGQCRYVDPTSRFASYLGTTAESISPGTPIYLLNDTTYFYGSHPSAGYLSEDRKITNMPDPIANWQPITGDTVIASPSRIPELEGWIQSHPGGQAKFVYDCNNLILLSYQLP